MSRAKEILEAAFDPKANNSLELQAIDVLSKHGFKGKFKGETGVFNYKGIPVTFTYGNENLYFELHKLYTKDDWKGQVGALAKFLDSINDGGGFQK